MYSKQTNIIGKLTGRQCQRDLIQMYSIPAEWGITPALRKGIGTVSETDIPL